MSKTKKALVLIMTLIMMVTLCACGDSSQNTADKQTVVEVTDLLGRAVEVPGDADAFACIGPGALRLYCYVADSSQLVGVESSEIEWGSSGRPYTMSLGDLSNAVVIGPGGPGNAPDAELLFNAAPDVIFTMYNSESSAVDELQEKTGIPVVALSYGEQEVFDQDIYDSMTLIGKITGNEERAAEVVKFMQDTKTDLNDRTKDISDKPLVYFGGQSNQGSHGIESTVGNYVLFEALNIRNASAESGISNYAMIDKEQILEMDPDAIVIDAGGYEIITDDYASNPDFYNALDAVEEGKVYMQMPYNWYYTNLEIAIADAYYIGSVIYPEAFSDINVEDKFDEISNFMLGINSYDAIAENYYGGYQTVQFEK